MKISRHVILQTIILVLSGRSLNIISSLSQEKEEEDDAWVEFAWNNNF